MPRALNEFEKRDRLVAKMEERKAAETAPTPAINGATRKKRNVFNGTEAKISVQQPTCLYRHRWTHTSSYG